MSNGPTAGQGPQNRARRRRPDRLVQWLRSPWWQALVLAPLLPAVVWLQGWTALDAALTARLSVKTEAVQALVAASPMTWQFQEYRLTELLERLPMRLLDEQARLRPLVGKPLVLTGLVPPAPLLWREQPVLDAGREVAQVGMAVSLRPLMLRTGAALLLSLLLAGWWARARGAARRLDYQLLQQREQARVTLASIHDAVITTDTSGRIRSLNPAAERLAQVREHAVLGRSFSEVFPLLDERTMQAVPDPSQAADLARPRDDGDSRELALQRADGSSLGIELGASTLVDSLGSPLGATLVLRDVSALRRMAQRISWAATHDALTGLVNRREFEARVDAALLSAQNSGTQHVVCFVDLDQFKVVNDTCGHAAGDGLLRQVTEVLQHQLRDADTLARLGGDEFGILLQGCSLARAQSIAEHLLQVVRDFRYHHGEHVFSVGASIGLAVLDRDSVSVAEVFSNADSACYWAKEQGRNRVCSHQSNDLDQSRRRHEMDWAVRLGQALDEQRLTLHYQPYRALKPELADRPHLEILLRMTDEHGALVPPGSFLPAAERFGLMPRIDRWVIAETFARHQGLRAQFGASLVCAINLSGSTINAEGLCEYIVAQAAHYQVPARGVCFEITETVAINSIRRTDALMRQLKQQGFLFALDDFGIGTSSFAYLRSLPVDYLKIDGSFVRDIAHDAVDRAMVETIHRIGQLMGLRTVGEYAETEAVIDALQGLGVDYAQGYAVQRPAPLPALRLSVAADGGGPRC